MSLEIAIQENTNAIHALIAAIGNGLSASPAQVAAVVAEAPATVKKETAAKKEVQKAAETVKPEAASTQPTAEATAAPEPKAEASEASADAPTYQDAAAAITKLSRAKGRDAAVAVLASFGAAKLPDVKPEQFADVIAAAAKAEA
jgi:hypothetical protein